MRLRLRGLPRVPTSIASKRCELIEVIREAICCPLRVARHALEGSVLDNLPTMNADEVPAHLLAELSQPIVIKADVLTASNNYNLIVIVIAEKGRQNIATLPLASPDPLCRLPIHPSLPRHHHRSLRHRERGRERDREREDERERERTSEGVRTTSVALWVVSHLYVPLWNWSNLQVIRAAAGPPVRPGLWSAT